jgi:hypothetical protein
VWALVPEPGAVEFLEDWRAGYLTAFPDHTPTARFLSTRLGAAATET